MSRIQTQGVHHITFVGSNREATIDFYQGVLGMPLVFEQPNLDVPEENHLYFDAGDGRLITFFVRPTRENDPKPNPRGSETCTTWRSPCRGQPTPRSPGVSRSAASRTPARSIAASWISIYFRDPNGQLLELACFKFEPPNGYTHSDVLALAHRIRLAAGDYNIADRHLADALAELAARRAPKPEPESAPVGASHS